MVQARDGESSVSRARATAFDREYAGASNVSGSGIQIQGDVNIGQGKLAYPRLQGKCNERIL